jgi:peptidoglycan/LPS O-acetylase OafA/YrhL
MPARGVQLAIALLIGMILLRIYSPQLGKVPMSWIVFLLLALVLLPDHGKAVFRNPLLFTIGGMCYSLYLVHSAVISALARVVVPLVETWTYWHQFLVFALLALVAVGLAGTVFYLLVEKTAQKWRLRIKY